MENGEDAADHDYGGQKDTCKRSKSHDPIFVLPAIG